MRDYRMKYTENALNILTAKTFKGIGNAWINKNFINKNLSYYEDIVEVLKKNAKEEVTENIFLEKRRELEEKLDMMSSYCDGVVAVELISCKI
jgi:DNA processing protein